MSPHVHKYYSSESESDEEYAMSYICLSDADKSPTNNESMLPISESDDDKSALSSGEELSMDCDLPTVHVHSQPVPSHPLPFPCVSAQWYKHQGMLAVKNVARERSRHANPPTFDEEGVIKYISRSKVKGSLQDNIQTLRERAQET